MTGYLPGNTCQDRFGFEPEVTTKVRRLGYKMMEVPIHYDGRSYAAGKKIGWKDGISAVWCILRIRLAGLNSFTSFP